MELILTKVRMSFPALWEPKAVGTDPKAKPAYGARYAIEPGSENAKKIEAAVMQVAEEKWPGKGAQVLAQLKKDNRVCYVEGPYCNKDGEAYDGFEDMFNIGTRNEKLRPTVKDRFNNTVEEGDAGAPYAGCYVHAAIDIWAQDNSYGRRINASTQGVMFAEDGQAFSGGRPANDTTFAGLAASPDVSDFT